MAAPLRQRQIARATAFIEDRLADRLTISRIAQHVCLSPFHFQRLFFEIVGENVSDYIRRRRLERAANTMLAQDDLRLIDLALECGFETHSAFSRAFRTHFGVTPGKFRSVRGNVDKGIGKNRPFLLPNMNKPARIEAQVTELPDMWLLYRSQEGMEAGGFFPDKDSLQQQLDDLRQCAGAGLLHLAGAYREGPHGFTDHAAVGCFGGLFRDKQMLRWSGEWICIKAAKWALIHHYGHYEHLYLTWNRACQNWLPTTGLRMRNDWAFETYLAAPDNIDFSVPSAIVHIPIEA